MDGCGRPGLKEQYLEMLTLSHTQAFDQRGEMGLFLLHIQAIGALAMAIRLERLPPSRHLTPRPGHRNNMHCFRRGDPGAAHTPFLHAVASFSAVPTAGQPVTPRVLPGLVAVACSLTDSEHMRGAAAAGAVSTAALDASLFDSCPISIPLPPSMIKLDGGGISTAGGSSASSNTAGGGHSITGGGGCGDGGGGDAATWPFRLPLPAAARACTLEGWDGVGVLAGDGQLGSIPVADLELLQAVFAEGEEGGGGGAVDVKVEV